LEQTSRHGGCSIALDKVIYDRENKNSRRRRIDAGHTPLPVRSLARFLHGTHNQHTESTPVKRYCTSCCAGAQDAANADLDWLAGGVGQNLEQAREISLTLARLHRSLHEVKVRIGNRVVRTSIPAPAYKLPGDHGIRFERGLIAGVIFRRNSPRHVGKDRFHSWHHPLDRLQESSSGQVFTLPNHQPLEKAQHRTYAEGQDSNIECRGVTDLVPDEQRLIAKDRQNRLGAVEDFRRPGIEDRAGWRSNPIRTAQYGAVKIRNSAMTITSIAITGSGASSFARTNACGSTLSAGAHCTISATFTPASVGFLSASLVVTDNAAGSPQAVTLSGTGVGAPLAGLSPATLTFNALAVGTTSPAQTVKLTNTGSAAMTINSIAITGSGASSFFQSNTCGSTLSAGAHCTVSVTFHPTSTGSLGASLTVTDNAAGSPHAVTLSGTGVGTPVVSLGPAALTFSSLAVGTTSAAQTVTLTNTGNAALTITSIAIAGRGASSFRQTNACGSTLNAGAHCTVSVTFHPTSAGSLTASLTVTDNAAGNSQSVALNGASR
jgi:hypothetical protein